MCLLCRGSNSDAEQEETLRCQRCGFEKPKGEYSGARWQKRLQADRVAICLQCDTEKEKEATHPCNQCGQSKL